MASKSTSKKKQKQEPRRAEFLFGTELELMTVIKECASSFRRGRAFEQFFKLMRDVAPCLPGPSGVHTPYGRCYVDCSHIEIATAECDNPYTMVSVLERLIAIACETADRLEAAGCDFFLANNNHSGFLTTESPTWGSHENILSEIHPRHYGLELLPFLISRLYAGSGGVTWPDGRFVASNRALRMTVAMGSSSTTERAVHFIRDEHHVAKNSGRFRYHLICGDGKRSQFNTALTFGATALAMKAIFHDRETKEQAKEVAARLEERGWLDTMREWNVLRWGQRPLSVNPEAIEVQRIYLEGAKRFRASLGDDAPEWIERILNDWEEVLDAYEAVDLDWLGARLDAFTKYRLYTDVLRQAGKDWFTIEADEEIFQELMFLDHDFHDLRSKDSVFRRLDEQGLLRQRVAEEILPGREQEPYVPEIKTRAVARARFLKENHQQTGIQVDWMRITDGRNLRFLRLDDPFEQTVGDWIDAPRPVSSRVRERLDRPPFPWEEGANNLLDQVRVAYRRGNYRLADRTLAALENGRASEGTVATPEMLRYRAWIDARRGIPHAERWLDRLYVRGPRALRGISDYCFVHRHVGLGRSPKLDAWIDRGLRVLVGARQIDAPDPDGAHGFREIAIEHRTHLGRHDEARELLDEALDPEQFDAGPDHISARLLTTAGDHHAATGDRDRAESFYRHAVEFHREHDYEPALADGPYTSLARFERSPRRALNWIRQAIEIQEQYGSTLGRVRSYLIESKLMRGQTGAEHSPEAVITLARGAMVLRHCPVFRHIVDNWDEWLDDPESGLDGQRLQALEPVEQSAGEQPRTNTES